MMISTKGRYALRIMIDLAQNAQEDCVSLKSISERQQLSMKYLESIISLLTKAGLVSSQRGKAGGYSLTKKPSEYTVSDILKLTEGELVPVACLSDCSCQRTDNCLTLPMWQCLDDIIEGYLTKVSIQDILDGNVMK